MRPDRYWIYKASAPWEWKKGSIVTLGVVLAAVFVGVTVSSIGRVHDALDVIVGIPLSAVFWWLFLGRGYLRSVRKWREVHPRDEQVAA